MKKHPLVCVLMGIAILAIPQSAPAQDSELAEEPAQEAEFVSDRVIEEVIVTAQKREQVAADIGMAIDVFAGQDLREAGSSSLIDVAQFSPGLNVRGPFGDFGYPIITLRGVNTDGFIETLPQSTGVYVDGVYLSQPPMLSYRLLDIDRMEVLKGPQGTIFGRNTIAGAVSFVSKRPTFDPGGYVDFGFGRYSRFNLEAAYGGPLSDTVAARFAVKTVQQSDSPLTNLHPDVDDGGEIDQLAGRFSLLFVPNDKVDLLLQVNVGEDNSDLWPFALIPGGEDTDGDGIPDRLCDEFARGDVEAAQVNCIAADPFLSGDTFNDTDGDLYTNNLNGIGSHRNRSTGIVAELNWDLGAAVLTAVTGWDDFERRDVIDEDAGPTAALDNIRSSDITQFSQEVRLASSQAEIAWLAGVYYSTDEMEGAPSFNQAGRLDFNQLDTDTTAVFGQAEFALRDDVALTAGARFTWVDRGFFYQTNAGFAPPELQEGATDSFSDSDWSGRLALDWDVSDDTLFYASISRGFNAGTYNSQFINEISPTKSEWILAYEAGVKNTFAGGRANLEASAFYYDYQDMQVVAVVPRGTIDANVLTNADEATLSGFELQLRALPADWLDLNVGVSYVDSEYGNLVVRVSGTGETSAPPYDAPIFGSNDVQIKGRPFPNTPELSLNSSLRITFPVNDRWEFFGQADVLWEDEIPRDLQGTLALYTEAHWNVDARLGVEGTDGKWSFSLWSRNLTDEVYITEAYQVLGFGYFIAGANYSYPRTYGVSIGRAF